ncbi:MAG: stage V sporulation protein E [Roseibacillus sp.]|jgi:cell division protein FtsW|nr:stage V sporulation protein E [Roseibacillus sp.]MBP35513.1 stage V sporulation protein E [Roseibacillus sp.]MCP4731628.1 cell division protein FtsW [Roseibacillus sp.]MDP6208477.1 putative peptidoglycan glycosyltransferase FtsW [Roseibacillus sp.]MDP7308034.1 putative peptidoglycan glycosyltransferase FtsW [Roseibacillus sp.]|tara:strand:- start:5599 stop:6750 length:1152 start_codon:yes stop_codon:yes gene_type:complete
MGRRAAIILCISVAILVALGLIMLASTSAWVYGVDDDPYLLVKRQGIFTGVGLLAALVAGCIDYRILRRIWMPLLIAGCVLLTLCYVPGVQVEVKGEARWIWAPVIGRFQPSEVAKLVVIIALAAWFAQHQAEARSFLRGFVLPGLLLGIPVALIFFEKDMGTAVALGGAGFLLMFTAGTRVSLLSLVAVVGILGLYKAVESDPYRRMKFEALLNLDDPEVQRKAGYQQYRAKLALASGGLMGAGLGNGAEKHGYLPEAHTDFIFPVAGEELGLLCTLGIVFCFVLISTSGISIALHASDRFGKLLGLGLTAVIALPALMNIGVVTSVLPNTGLPLPFVSYGGTNLVFTLAAMGLLVSLHRRAYYAECAEMPIIKEKQLALKI